MTAKGAVLTVDHGPFIVRYTNDHHGMRQDFLVNTRPKGNDALQVNMLMSGPLLAHNAGPDIIEFMAPAANGNFEGPKFSYHGLLAWDARGKILPARMHSQGSTLKILVEDLGAIYPITIDPLSSNADALLQANEPGAAFGSCTSSAGDVNGDGFSDLLVGAPDFDQGAGEEGAVFLFSGSASGVSTTPDWIWNGDQAGAHVGYAVATAGDVNGDGISDVLVGSPDRSNGQLNEGQVLLFFGGPTGLSATPDRTFESNQIGARMGASVATAGDLNGDGFSDILIGVPLFDFGQTDEGIVLVYNGSLTGPGVSASLIIQRDQVGANFGASLSCAGDVNGDGFSDVVIGAPLYDNTQTDEGGVFVYHGSAAGLGSVPNASRFRGQVGAQLGFSVSFAGDVNGDGYSDVIVGSPLLSGALSQQGQALLYRGSSTGIAASPTWTHNGGQANARAGSSVTGLGDLNGDGHADVAIGLPGYSNGQSNEGQVRIFKGVATLAGLSLTASWSFESQQVAAAMGSWVGAAGDVNGDGLADLVVGAPFFDSGEADEGVAMVFHGRTSMPLTTATWSVESDQVDAAMGECVARAGDVNGDGFSDVLVGAPLYTNGQVREGRVMLYSGSSTGLTSSPAWTAESNQAEARFGFSVGTAGDVNGDGYSDMIVGAPYYSNGQVEEGRAFLYLGSATGLASTPAWTFESNQTGARLGWSVSTAGDVNGDGYSDVIVGAYLYAATLTAEGRSYVFLGSATGLSATPVWIWDSGQINAFSGISVGLAGDVNGDGYDDVIIGAPFYDNAFSTEGAAFLFHGSPTGPENTYSWSAFGGMGSPQMGNLAGHAGDVNGDGYSDVFVAISRGSNGHASEGLVRIYHGSPNGLSASPALILEGGQDDARLGTGAAHAGDVNGDGYSDLILGAPKASSFYLNEGRALLHLGGPGGLSATPAWTATGGQTGVNLGSSVSGAGDLNGDGYADLLVGTPLYANGQSNEGRATMYLGNSGVGIARRTRQYRSDLTTPVQTGNNTFDLGCAWGVGQFARSPLGRGRMRIATEIKGHGPPFSGNPISNGMGITDEGVGWTNGGLSGLELTQLVATTPLNTSHPTWRTRVRYHPATSINGQMLGPWYHAGIHDIQVPSLKVELTPCGPLPIDLIEFSGSCVNGRVQIRWTTLSELDIDQFHIEYSMDGVQWDHAGSTRAIGNSHATTQYVWQGGPEQEDRAYYRLETSSPSGERVVERTLAAPRCTETSNELHVFPNPVQNGTIQVIWDGTNGHLLRVNDLMGHIVAHVAPDTQDGRTTFRFHSGTLSSGTYFGVLLDPSGIKLATARIIVL
jgi:hypothetical protein